NHYEMVFIQIIFGKIFVFGFYGKVFYWRIVSFFNNFGFHTYIFAIHFWVATIGNEFFFFAIHLKGPSKFLYRFWRIFWNNHPIHYVLAYGIRSKIYRWQVHQHMVTKP